MQSCNDGDGGAGYDDDSSGGTDGGMVVA